MSKLLEGNCSILAILREQLKVATGVNRKMTGVGFFVDFLLPSNVPCISSKPSFQIKDVIAEIKELQNGVGFVLFIGDGKLATLEGFTFGEEWPEQISGFQLSYTNANRNIEALQKTVQGDH